MSDPLHSHSHGDGVASFIFPLRFFGLNLGRRVTLLPISGKRLVVHSTAPFSDNHLRAMERLGRPAFLLDATTMHDTFSRDAREILPNAEYFVPEGFPKKGAGPTARPLSEINASTGSEIQTERLEGMRFLTEYACFHPASRTLILGDLLFNLDQSSGYTKWAMRNLLGVKEWPAIDRPVRMAVKDKEAFVSSLQRILAWDFDRIIVAHGSPIETNGKQHLIDAALRSGFILHI